MTSEHWGTLRHSTTPPWRRCPWTWPILSRRLPASVCPPISDCFRSKSLFPTIRILKLPFSKFHPEFTQHLTWFWKNDLLTCSICHCLLSTLKFSQRLNTLLHARTVSKSTFKVQWWHYTCWLLAKRHCWFAACVRFGCCSVGRLTRAVWTRRCSEWTAVWLTSSVFKQSSVYLHNARPRSCLQQVLGSGSKQDMINKMSCTVADKFDPLYCCASLLFLLSHCGRNPVQPFVQ